MGSRWLVLLALVACKDRDSADDSLPTVEASCEGGDWAGDLSADSWEGPLVAPGGDIRYFGGPLSDPNRIYAGSTNNGLFRSDDGGQTWRSMPTERSHILGEMSTLGDDADTLIITSEELWRSEDGGETWAVVEGLGSTNPQEGVRATLYADGRLWAIQGTGALHASDDGGVTFNYVGTAAFPEPAPHNPIGDSGWQWQLASSGDGTLYAMFDGMGVLASDDGGETWRGVWYGPVTAGTLAARGNQVYFAEVDLVFASDDRGETTREVGLAPGSVSRIAYRTDTELVLATDTQLYLGAESSWTEFGPPIESHIQGLMPRDDGHLLVGHGEGILYYDGAEWSDRSEGILDEDLAVLLAHPSCPETVYVGTQCQRGLYLSEDWGESLAHIDYYLHYVMVARVNPQRPEEIWVTNDNQLLMSPDLGLNWRDVIQDPDIIYHVHGLDLDPRDPDHVLVGSVGSGIWADETMKVYESFDAGATWASASEGLPQSQASAHAIHFVRSEPGVVLLGTFKGDDITHAVGSGEGLFRSEDNGSTWSQVDLGGARDIAKLAECDGALYASADLTLRRSEDAGATWTTVLDRPAPVLAVACHGDTVLAFDQDHLVQRSDDRGASWVDYSANMGQTPLGNQFIHDLAITADGEVVLLAVRDEGVYRRALR
ncbi:MAG: hypothetical protein H6741_23180 [Alphaproteobacteria bacterium]|nr:hypothetical protein [Alphaproteobacteria bacterium]